MKQNVTLGPLSLLSFEEKNKDKRGTFLCVSTSNCRKQFLNKFTVGSRIRSKKVQIACSSQPPNSVMSHPDPKSGYLILFKIEKVDLQQKLWISVFCVHIFGKRLLKVMKD